MKISHKNKWEENIQKYHKIKDKYGLIKELTDN